MEKNKLMWAVCASVLLLIGYTTAEARKSKKTDKQHKLEYIAWALQVRRVHEIGYDILKKNVETLADREKGTRYDFGVYAMSGVEFPRDKRKFIRKYFNLGEGLTVVHVAENSPAEKAGVLDGDRLLKINGRVIRSTPITFADAARARLNFIVNKFYNKTGSVKLTVERKGTEHTFNIVPELICSANLNVAIDDRVNNAYVTGTKNVTVGMGLANRLNSDNQLALVLGHELAHITCNHIGKKRIGSIAGILVGEGIKGATGVDVSGVTSRIGGNVFSHKYELEADYVGLYNVARAGYDVRDAPYFFRDLNSSDDKPSGGFKGSLSHPSNEERFKKLTVAVHEILEKKLHGEVLVPDYKVFRQNF